MSNWGKIAPVAALFAAVLFFALFHGCHHGHRSGSDILVVTTSSLPDGSVGLAYEATLTATRSYGPYNFSWSLDSGSGPLPNGLVRVFRQNGKGGLSYLGEQTVRYVPIKADIEINLGPDDLVVYESRKDSTKRYNFSFNKHDRVNGWDESQGWIDEIRNYRDKPIVFELRTVRSGDVEYRASRKTILFDYRTTEIKLTVKARDKVEHPFTLVFHMGENKKQERVEIR